MSNIVDKPPFEVGRIDEESHTLQVVMWNLEENDTISVVNAGFWLRVMNAPPISLVHTVINNNPLVGVVVWRGGCQLRCRPRHLTEALNAEVSRHQPSCCFTVRRSQSPLYIQCSFVGGARVLHPSHVRIFS
ncbi:hypothetical protein TNCV_3913151 [Trichonephila clavipes]|nr:hypothetical protein TNCV_3913151 [Trichonephila clavipes]